MLTNSGIWESIFNMQPKYHLVQHIFKLEQKKIRFATNLVSELRMSCDDRIGVEEFMTCKALRHRQDRQWKDCNEGYLKTLERKESESVTT